MKTIFKRNLSIRVSFIIIAVLVIAIVLVSFLYFSPWDSTKLGAVYAGLLTGLFVALIQFLIAWNDYRANEKIKALKIINILENRDNRKFYEDYIRNAQKSIDMMGVTGSRFMDHFANDDPNAEERAKVLINRLQNNVKVRILVPNPNQLPTGSERQKAKSVQEKFRALADEFDNFKYYTFKHKPAHSIFKVDEKCIVGPVFPGVSSKYTPAILSYSNSAYAEKYIDYFNAEWEQCQNPQ